MGGGSKKRAQGPGTSTLVVVGVVLLIAGLALGYALGRSGEEPDTTGAPAEPTATAGDNPVTPPVTPPTTETTPPADVPPTEPVAEGSAIATVTTPPESTLAMIDPSKLDAGARYSVRFSPYGFGPPQGGVTLVVRIAEAALESEGVRAMDFTGRNVLVMVDPAEAPVTQGGTYTATMTFVESGGLLQPVLGGIAPAE